MNLHHLRGVPEEGVGALKHVRVLTVYKIFYIYICCAFIGLDNKLCKMHGTYVSSRIENSH